MSTEGLYKLSETRVFRNQPNNQSEKEQLISGCSFLMCKMHKESQ